MARPNRYDLGLWIVTFLLDIPMKCCQLSAVCFNPPHKHAYLNWPRDTSGRHAEILCCLKTIYIFLSAFTFDCYHFPLLLIYQVCSREPKDSYIFSCKWHMDVWGYIVGDVHLWAGTLDWTKWQSGKTIYTTSLQIQ